LNPRDNFSGLYDWVIDIDLLSNVSFFLHIFADLKEIFMNEIFFGTLKTAQFHLGTHSKLFSLEEFWAARLMYQDLNALLCFHCVIALPEPELPKIKIFLTDNHTFKNTQESTEKN